MEAKSETAITIITNTTAVTTLDIKKNKKNVIEHGLPKKKRGAIELFKLALYMFRRKSGKTKSIHVDVASKGMWKKLVASMRPLHLQSNQSPPPSIQALPMPEPVGIPLIELLDEVFTPPTSPSVANEASSSSGSSEDSMSRYASAVNLQELDRCNDSEEYDDGYGDYGGDEMIDAKAEEFIARFYEQMRLQTLSYNQKYNQSIL